jgi:hypothetical protein
MTPEDKFKFDLEGYLVVKNVHTPEEVAEMNAIADAAYPGEYDEKGLRRTSRPSLWGPPFQQLIDHPKLLPYLEGLLGPKFRIDHDYCIFMQKGGKGGNLHGGPTPQNNIPGDHWYRHHNGIIRNGLTVFTTCLAPAPAGAGGFACIPGTHKSNFIADIPDQVRTFHQPAHYVHQPVADAGDVIIFTEALVHGTAEWQADHERRTVLYKYSPGHSSWSSTHYNPDNYPNVTDQQRRIMAPPYVGSRPDSIEEE